MKATLDWKDGMTFAAKIRQHEFTLDTHSLGGKDLGPTPKETVISSVLGCTGMDVVALLKKFRIPLRSLSLQGNAEPRGPHPQIFSQIDVVFNLEIDFTDAPAQLPKVIEAVELSLTKYCGVSAMVAPTSPIFYTVMVNGEIEGRGQADFTPASKS